LVAFAFVVALAVVVLALVVAFDAVAFVFAATFAVDFFTAALVFAADFFADFVALSVVFVTVVFFLGVVAMSSLSFVFKPSGRVIDTPDFSLYNLDTINQFVWFTRPRR
jgi:hypothetical protein